MSTPVPTLGMSGSGRWSSVERPENYRELLLRLFPNGSAPLNAVLAKLGKESTDDPHYHWFTKKYQDKGFDLVGSGVYLEPELTNAYTSNAATAGQSVYASTTLDTAKRIREGHEVILRDSDDHSNDLVCRVIQVGRLTDTTSFIECQLLHADGDGNAGAASADRILIAGNMNAEGAARPMSIAYNNAEWGNYCQIFRNSLSMSRTAMKTRLRTPDQYKEAKKDTMLDHNAEMEDAFIWGRKTLGFDANGQPIRTTDGIVNMIRAGYPANIIDVARDATYSGQTFSQFGKTALDAQMEQSFREGDATEKFVLCGNAYMLAIQNIVEANSMYNITQGEAKYGIKVTTLESTFGVWHLKRAPRFTKETSTSASALVLEPDKIKLRYVDDTFFTPDDNFKKGGGNGVDGKEEEFITEAGIELHHPELHMYISNFGIDSLV